MLLPVADAKASKQNQKHKQVVDAQGSFDRVSRNKLQRPSAAPCSKLSQKANPAATSAMNKLHSHASFGLGSLRLLCGSSAIGHNQPQHRCMKPIHQSIGAPATRCSSHDLPCLRC